MKHTLSRQPFNEGWRFRFADGDWQDVTLPHTWNALDTMSTDPARWYRRGRGEYERAFTPPAAGQWWLEFEAVAQRGVVFFDDARLAEHHGGYTAFAVRVPDRAGTLRVAADNTPDPDLIPSDRSDFFLYGGITRNVWLYQTGSTWIDWLRVDTDIVQGRGEIRLRGVLAGAVGAACTLQIALHRVGDDRALLEAGYAPDGAFDLTLPPLPDVALWSPESPVLYTLTAVLHAADGRLLDRVTERIGFRTAAFPAGGPFFLNGERLLLRGTHRHEDWAGYGGAVPDAITRREFAMIKAAGFNFVRLGHYPQSRAALDACDELGLIVWEELPWCRGGIGGAVFKDHTQAMLDEMISQHYNHPSILFWGVGNELDWESDHPGSSDDAVRDFLAALHTRSHQLDPARWTALRRFDYGADVVDVYSPSIWAGWYRGRYTDYAANLGTAARRFPRLLHAEWGGDSHLGRHSAGPHIAVAVDSSADNAEVTGTATSREGFARYSKDGDWSESYILDLMDWHLCVQADQPDLAGTLQWAFKDFGTPLRPENPIPFVNQKGLIDRCGRRKDSYFLFQAHQTPQPVVRIEGHHWRLRPAEQPHRVRVISSGAAVELFVDGVSAGQRLRDPAGSALRGFVWEVTLTPGEHTLRAVGDDGAEDVLHCHAEVTGSRARSLRWEAEAQPDGALLTFQLVDDGGRPVLADERRVHVHAQPPDAVRSHQGCMGGSSVIETANGRADLHLNLQKSATLHIHVAGLGRWEITLALSGVGDVESDSG